MTANVTADITSMVDNPDATVDVYDNVPPIYKIDFGLYVVPHQEKDNIEGFIKKVDNEEIVKHCHEQISGYISSESYGDPALSVTLDPYAPISGDFPGMSAYMCEHGEYTQPVSCFNSTIASVDMNCSLEPYVDKLYWKIDGVS